MLGLSLLLQGCTDPIVDDTPAPIASCAAVKVEGLPWLYIPKLKAGESHVARCILPGFEGPDEATVTCTHTGALQPQPLPVCKKVTDWCLAQTRDGYEVPSAALGAKVQVKCSEDGLVPSSAEVTCGMRHKFEPTPQCVDPADTTTTATSTTGAAVDPTTTTTRIQCPAVRNNSWIVVQSQFAGESASVECPIGYEAVPTSVTCKDTGSFEPEPRCNFIPDYCLGKSTGTGGLKYAAAAFGATTEIECSEEGYVPKSATATCGVRGAFSPKPECEKPGRRMIALRGGA